MLEGAALNALDPGTAAPRPAEAGQRLRALIMSGDIRPGQRINIEDAARHLSLSPTPVREALAGLESEGLVVKIPLRGYRTTELLTRAELVELYELRRLIEPHAASAAARRRSADSAQALADELAAMRAQPVPPPAIDLSGHDERLHGLIFRAAGNELISRTYERLHCHLHLFRLSYSATYGHHTVDEHAGIVGAIRAGDPEQADLAMREHLDLSLERVLGAYEG